ncbi:MAG TPA: protein translocase subunit SecF [Candidatus Eisenbacteria bacterium]|nr:protein translocase subunit SecF [Candidatus Eisenbacteria bacterium]
MNIIAKKNWYFALSLLVIIPGTLSLILFGFKPSIDFSGGSRFTFSNVKNADVQGIQQEFVNKKVKVETISTAGTTLLMRTVPVEQAVHNTILSDIHKKLPGVREDEFATVGPTIGKETTTNALMGVGLASLLIVLYIAWSFRGVRKPANSFQFGVTAIVALLHDALVLLGIFSILGHFFNVEIDSLFVTAVLTVIGFSVHDTIVVFDRVRENLRKMPLNSFGEVVNASIIQTLGRSLNTSLTVILVLFALLLFGGDSTKWFVVALLVGIISGTYSSIFNAAPLLVLWNELSSRPRNKK